jgi:hypothetical protein
MIIVRLEKSKSRSGKHAARSIVLLVSEQGEVKEAKPTQLRSIRPLYAVGEAYEAAYRVPPGHFLVYVYLVKNLRNHVKGYIEVYSNDGRLLYRAVYRKLKLRRGTGDPSYAWAVRRVADYLKLYVKNTNLGDEKLQERAQRATR